MSRADGVGPSLIAGIRKGTIKEITTCDRNSLLHIAKVCTVQHQCIFTEYELCGVL